MNLNELPGLGNRWPLGPLCLTSCELPGTPGRLDARWRWGVLPYWVRKENQRAPTDLVGGYDLRVCDHPPPRTGLWTRESPFSTHLSLTWQVAPTMATTQGPFRHGHLRLLGAACKDRVGS